VGQYRGRAGNASARTNTLRRMRRAVLLVASAGLLIGPAVLAFFAGGYFDGPRAAAAGTAWALVLVLALMGPWPLPASAPGWMAVGGLAGLTVWSAISTAWAPRIDPAVDSVQRLLLYLAVLLAAIVVLRDRRVARAVEPVLALGALVVIGYGLAERLLPGLFQVDGSFAAGGRLEQPITYWNAEGLLSAMGLVLCIRVAGDRTRSAQVRVVGAAGCAPLALGAYLSYSRGAVAAALIGAIVLLAAAPTKPQLRAAIIGLASGTAASVVAAALRGVASLEGSAAELQRDGAVMLVALVGLMLVASLLAARFVADERRGAAEVGTLVFAPRLPAVAGVTVLLCAVGLVAGGLLENGGGVERSGAGASRFASVDSVRYEYWDVGAGAFAEHPARGVGAGGFRVVWRMERQVAANATEVHSLLLEMATELGVPGLVFLGLFLGGVASAGRQAHRRGAPLAAGASAACTVWLLHAAIDWDWQLPAVTLPALVLAAGLLAGSELPGRRLTAARDGAAPAPEPLPTSPPGVEVGVGSRPMRLVPRSRGPEVR
jgi:hypothetical protein